VALGAHVAAVSRRLPNFRGKTALAHRLRHVYPAKGEAFRITLRTGERLLVPADSVMGWQAAFTGAWDAELIAHASRYIRPGTVALDIGAAIGLWTVPLGKVARQVGAHVVAVEPLPGNAQWLRENLTLNNLGHHVRVEHIAVASQPGTLKIDSDEKGGGSAAISTNGHGVDIPVRRLDDLPLPAPVSFIKMDIEGFELEALRGASRLLEEDRPVIFGEFSHEWLTIRHEDPDPLLRALRDTGYSINAVDVLRSRPWRAPDTVVLTALKPPFSGVDADLLLLPN
jgi:FkbM family methyltransferase